jgi:hypothetical protein
MAEHLMSDPKRVAVVGLLTIAAGMASVPAAAQTDPTRPPDAPVAGNGNAETTVLKSILISDQRTEAVIGDSIVRVGSMVGRARVVKISAGEVVLRDENGLRTLKLFPGIERRVIGSEAGEGEGAKRNSREKNRK